MPVTLAENQNYRDFVAQVARDCGCFEFKRDEILWHYTSADGFLGILQSSSLYATQVSSLNDANETIYASKIFCDAVEVLIGEKEGDSTERLFLLKVLELVRKENLVAFRGRSQFFVACFCGDQDDLTQWERYGKGGYAIGFYARGLNREPNSTVYRVNYERPVHLEAAKQLADATLRFYLEGLTPERFQEPDKWAEDFLTAWDQWIYKLAPLVKDSTWRAENEFRLVHELKNSEFNQVRFRQKGNALCRYIPLQTRSWVPRRAPLLPIAKIMMSPGIDVETSIVSIRLLLDQLGYVGQIPIEASQITLRS